MASLTMIAPQDLEEAINAIRPAIGTPGEVRAAVQVMAALITDRNATPEDAAELVIALFEAARG
jgi:hypothetical protein